MSAETGQKRKAGSPASTNGSDGADGASKKAKTDANVGSQAVVVAEAKSTALTVAAQQSGIKRTSNLQAPTMLLEGHQSHIYTAKFNAAGNVLASGAYDRSIYLWNVYGDCKNFAVLSGHKKAVLHLEWSRDSELLYSASADMTGGVFDTNTFARVKTLREHTSFVNCITVARKGDPIFATCSDDGSLKVWDMRIRASQKTFDTEFPITSVAFSDDRSMLFSAGIDEQIVAWDLIAGKIAFTMPGHQDIVTGLEVSPDGSYLLSNSMDHTLRQWDIRPYVKNPNQRLVKVYIGATHDIQRNLLKCGWSPDGTKVAAGSADRFVYVWDVATTGILHKLPGHNGAVNEVDFHPNEPIIASCSNDKRIFIGEI